MTPPGPRAMTAQAGAVGADEREELLCYVVACADKLSREGFPIMGRTLKTAVRCLATPPAAVPVDALEGLVDRLNALEEYADEARVAYAGDHSSGTFRRIAERTQGIRDELTQLIKERSNGR